jgi:hypothetical protein
MFTNVLKHYIYQILMKRSRLQLTDSETKSSIDRSDRYLSILGNFHISEDPLINDYIRLLKM